MSVRIYQVPAQYVKFDLVEKSQHKIHILIKKEEETSDNLLFLERMMSSVHVDTKASVNIANNDWLKKVTLRSLLLHHEPLNIIIFGINADELTIDFSLPGYRCIHMNKHKILYIESISVVQNSKQRKLQIWNELKFMFGEK